MVWLCFKCIRWIFRLLRLMVMDDVIVIEVDISFVLVDVNRFGNCCFRIFLFFVFWVISKCCVRLDVIILLVLKVDVLFELLVWKCVRIRILIGLLDIFWIVFSVDLLSFVVVWVLIISKLCLFMIILVLL